MAKGNLPEELTSIRLNRTKVKRDETRQNLARPPSSYDRSEPLNCRWFGCAPQNRWVQSRFQLDYDFSAMSVDRAQGATFSVPVRQKSSTREGGIDQHFPVKGLPVS